MVRKMFIPTPKEIDLPMFNNIRFFWGIAFLFFPQIALVWRIVVMMLLFYAGHWWKLNNETENNGKEKDNKQDTYCLNLTTLSKKSIAIVSASSIIIFTLCCLFII
jgi:hypothetical protein